MTANSKARVNASQRAAAVATDEPRTQDTLQHAPRLTVEERQALGRSMRQRAPRGAHALWEAPTDRPDPIALLEAQAQTRLPELVSIRYARMRVSPFAFFRGSAVVMAHDLARTPISGIQTQLCGDCHCANFGAYASPERALLFDINDFDETYPGPWEWDVKRLATSLMVAGRDNGFSAADCRDAALAAARVYRERMAQFAEMGTLEVWYASVTADDVLGMIHDRQTKSRTREQLTKARQRGSAQAATKMTEVVNSQVIFVNTPPLVERVTEEALGAEVHTLFEQYMQTIRESRRQLLSRFSVVDVARKVVGVGSVGTRCFIVLLAGRDEQDPLILQVKEAEHSVLEPYLDAPHSKAHQGERVVTGQELMQAASDIFLGWLTGPRGRQFYWRQLRDMKASVDIEALTAANLRLYGELCGWALARAHARASGKAIEISSYLGTNDHFDQAVAMFASAYADQTIRDHQALVAAIQSGRLAASPDVT